MKLFTILNETIRAILCDTWFFLQSASENRLICDTLEVKVLGGSVHLPIYTEEPWDECPTSVKVLLVKHYLEEQGYEVEETTEEA